MSGAGDLSKRVTLQHPTMVSDGMGGWTVTFTDAATVWGAIWPVSANDTIQANATVLVVTHRIRIRYRSVLKTSWRIKFGNRYFAIVSIICPNEGREFLDLMVKESA